jgi:hypothetical protein
MRQVQAAKNSCLCPSRATHICSRAIHFERPPSLAVCPSSETDGRRAHESGRADDNRSLAISRRATLRQSTSHGASPRLKGRGAIANGQRHFSDDDLLARI